MKRILLCSIVLLVSACAEDKAKHFAAGAVGAAAVTHFTGSKLAGCGTAIAMGAAKEAYDRNHGGDADPADFAATSAGCVVTWAF